MKLTATVILLTAFLSGVNPSLAKTPFVQECVKKNKKSVVPINAFCTCVEQTALPLVTIPELRNNFQQMVLSGFDQKSKKMDSALSKAMDKLISPKVNKSNMNDLAKDKGFQKFMDESIKFITAIGDCPMK